MYSFLHELVLNIMSTWELKHTFVAVHGSKWTTTVGLYPTDDVTSSNLGEPVLSTWIFSPVTQPPPIPVTWPSIYTASLWTLGAKPGWHRGTVAPRSHYPSRSANKVLGAFLSRILIWVVCIMMALSSENKDGGTNKTAESCRLSPGWTWRGGRWQPVWR